MLSDSLLKFYAECFHKGDKSNARNELNQQSKMMRTKDSNGIYFAAGGIAAMLLTLTFMACIPDNSN